MNSLNYHTWIFAYLTWYISIAFWGINVYVKDNACCKFLFMLLDIWALHFGTLIRFLFDKETNAYLFVKNWHATCLVIVLQVVSLIYIVMVGIILSVLGACFIILVGSYNNSTGTEYLTGRFQSLTFPLRWVLGTKCKTQK